MWWALVWMIIGALLLCGATACGAIIGYTVAQQDAELKQKGALETKGRVIERLRRENSGLRALVKPKLHQGAKGLGLQP